MRPLLSLVILLFLACSAIAQVQRTKEDVESFLNWANQSGVEGLDNVRIKCGDGGDCTVHAARVLSKGEFVMAVPRNLTMTPPDTPIDELDANGMLQLRLIEEQAAGERSLWSGYIRMLPQGVTPIFTVTADDTSLINATQSYGWWTMYHSVLEQQARTLCHYGRDNEAPHSRGTSTHHFSLDACQWAVSSMRSRAFAIPHTMSQEPTPTLIPVIDMLNHRHWGNSPDCSGEHDGVPACVYRAPRDTEEGEELVLSYGALLTSSSAALYGFVADPPSAQVEWPKSRFLVEGNISKKEVAVEQQKGNLAAAACIRKVTMGSALHADCMASALKRAPPLSPHRM